MILRRKHWLLASLSCSALLLLLAHGSFKSTLPIVEQDGRKLTEFRGNSPTELNSLNYTSSSSTKSALLSAKKYIYKEPKRVISNKPSISNNKVNSVFSPPFRNSTVSLVNKKVASKSDQSNVPRLDRNNGVQKKTQSGSLPDHKNTNTNNSPKKVKAPRYPAKKSFQTKSGRRLPLPSNPMKMEMLQKQMVKHYPQLLNSGVSAAKYRITKEYSKFSGDVNFKPGSVVPRSQAKKILILTTWRSGSTFLGDIFNAYPGTFYSFEPLHELLKKQHFQDGPLKKDVLGIIKNIFNCNMKEHKSFFEYAKNNTFLLSHNSRYWQSCSINNAICFDPDFFNRICELMPVNVMKTVRLGAKPVEDLLKDSSLDLRVIHLVRDPRGTLHSRLKLSWCKAPVCSDPTVVCEDLFNDLIFAEKLQTKYPDRFMLVRYEDLGTQPDAMTNLILDFVGLTYTDTVRHFISEHTKLDEAKYLKSQSSPSVMAKRRRKKPTNAYSTFRDSKTTTFAWRTDFNYTKVEEIQKSCVKPLKALNLRIFDSESEYKDEEVPVLLPDN